MVFTTEKKKIFILVCLFRIISETAPPILTGLSLSFSCLNEFILEKRVIVKYHACEDACNNYNYSPTSMCT